MLTNLWLQIVLNQAPPWAPPASPHNPLCGSPDLGLGFGGLTHAGKRGEPTLKRRGKQKEEEQEEGMKANMTRDHWAGGL